MLLFLLLLSLLLLLLLFISCCLSFLIHLLIYEANLANIYIFSHSLYWKNLTLCSHTGDDRALGNAERYRHSASQFTLQLSSRLVQCPLLNVSMKNVLMRRESKTLTCNPHSWLYESSLLCHAVCTTSFPESFISPPPPRSLPTAPPQGR